MGRTALLRVITSESATGGSSSHSPTADLRGMLPAVALRKAEETSASLKKQALNLFAFCDEILKG